MVFGAYAYLLRLSKFYREFVVFQFVFTVPSSRSGFDIVFLDPSGFAAPKDEFRTHYLMCDFHKEFEDGCKEIYSDRCGRGGSQLSQHRRKHSFERSLPPHCSRKSNTTPNTTLSQLLPQILDIDVFQNERRVISDIIGRYVVASGMSIYESDSPAFKQFVIDLIQFGVAQGREIPLESIPEPISLRVSVDTRADDIMETLRLRVFKSLNTYGSIVLSADYGTQIDGYLILYASCLETFLVQISLRTDLIGLVKVKDADTTDDIYEKIKKAASWLLNEEQLKKCGWMCDGSERLRAVGQKFMSSTACTAHFLQLAAFHGFVSVNTYRPDESQNNDDSDSVADSVEDEEITDSADDADQEEMWLPLSGDFFKRPDPTDFGTSFPSSSELNDCEKAVTLLKTCSKLTRAVRQHPMLCDRLAMKPVIFDATHWMSSCRMLRSIPSVIEELRQLSSDNAEGLLTPKVTGLLNDISSSDLDIQELVKFLEIFESALKSLQTTSIYSHLVLLHLYKLERSIDTLMATSQSKIAKAACNSSLLYLRKKIIDHVSPIYLIATLLCRKYTKMVNLPEETREKAIQCAKSLLPQLFPNWKEKMEHGLGIYQPPAKKQKSNDDDPFAIFEEDNSSTPTLRDLDDFFDDELKRFSYLSSDTPFDEFWRSKEAAESFPLLQKLAFHVYSYPVSTSVCGQKYSSTLKYLLLDSRLKSDHQFMSKLLISKAQSS
ncbi:hypothetical protein WR25_24891 isoform B [Diploscapter pachys]|uniref:HAT C-terminal dimerisation domain-containing protein n=1 Tax=Diploscapter pachys TaxID=2018661 RepID=A0A2A2LI03_9BILA|nr:hypothetical protein WR25_24891 isoform B [Diploscapter pachys]